MATKHDIIIEQGTDFSTIINVTDEANNPLDLTGYSAAGQMKRWYTSMTSIPFVVTIGAGAITLSLTANTTSNTIHGKFVYDVDLVDPSGKISRVVEGLVTVTPGVTNMTIETTPVTYTPNTDFVVVPLDNFSNTV